MTAKARWAVLIALFCTSAGIASLSIFLSLSRPLSPLEAALLNVFLWAVAIGIGAVFSSLLVQQATIKSLEERAKPAIRRVSELLRSSKKLQMRIHQHNETSTSKGQAGDDALALFVEVQIGQLHAAVQDWKELLPEDYVDEVLADESASSNEGVMSWEKFEQTYRELGERIERSPQRGGYRPSVIIGVYPDGGMVGYFLWLEMNRRCPVIVAPQVESGPPEHEVKALGERLAAACLGPGPHRCLVVDSSIKTGAALLWTAELVRQTGEKYKLDIEVKTLCVIEYPLTEPPAIGVDFIGVKAALDLPFTKS